MESVAESEVQLAAVVNCEMFVLSLYHEFR